jgi:hypothetical protein
MNVPDWEKLIADAKAALQGASEEIWRLLAKNEKQARIIERLRAQIRRLGHTPDDADGE